MRSGGKWQQQKLAAADGGLWDYFGNVVDLGNDGNVAMVGDSRKGSGVAYVFTRSAGKWSQQARLTPANPDYGFGSPVALADDGRIVLVASIGATVGGNQSQGAVYVFRPIVPLTGANMLLLRQP